MAPRKGLSPFSYVISTDLSPHSYWYVLNSKVCGMTPTQYFKQSPIVSSFPADFHRVESCNLQLNDERHYQKKRSSSGMEVICSSFGLLSILLRQKTSPEVSEAASQLRNFLNNLDLSVIKPKAKSFSSPNLKEISEKDDLDTPEKALLMKKQSTWVIKDIHDVCHKHRESLAMVLSNMCAFGDLELRAIVYEIVEVVAVKRGVRELTSA